MWTLISCLVRKVNTVGTLFDLAKDSATVFFVEKKW